MLIDTHAHIDMEDFEADFEQMLQRAAENGVEKIIIPAVEPSTFERVIKTAEKSENLYAATGVHPEDAKNFTQESLEKMEEMIKHPKVVAVGEIGLDYYWDRSYNDIQKEVFALQIEFAKKHNKPVIVHDREAHGDSLAIVKEYPALRGVFHCYSGSVEMARELLALGWYLGFDGPVTYKNARKTVEVAEMVPLNRILIETDSPYMSPVPLRGKRNDSRNVFYIAEKLAQIKGMTTEELARLTMENGKSLFGIQ